jgi:L-ascorbate metabolism protein UlaG (beta-lactamase superfamily)
MLKSFGKLPTGRRLERIKKSVQYREGYFQNIIETPLMVKGVSYVGLTLEYFKRKEGQEPKQAIPFIKPELFTIPATYPVIIWFGHSSYLIMINGVTILVDPVFSENPSPISWLGKKAFKSTTPLSADDLPVIDVVLITHDHYDHLDYKTIQSINGKVKHYCTSLGIGAHLEHWGIASDKIVELDWWEKISISYELEITATPARHFSGRGFKRNQTLWSSFVIKSLGYTFFCGGDSGYDDSFKTIGKKFGTFDMAILDCGQYDARWPDIHMVPEQTVQACIDLNAKALLPVHWAKFALAHHTWKEPVERIINAAKLRQVQVTTPQPGELIILNDRALPNSRWWEEI